jgi:hypothetical protein
MSSLNPIPRSVRRQQVTAADAQAVFGPTNFKVWDVSDVRVRVKAGGVGSFITQSAGVTVALTGAAPSPVTITFDVGRAAGDVVRMEGARTAERSTDVTMAGTIRGAALEAELDKAVTILQEVRRDIDDALSGTIDGGSPVGVVTVPSPEGGMTLPSAATRANKLLGFNNAGDPVATTPAGLPTNLVTVPVAETGGIEIPAAAARANKLLAFDNAGAPIASAKPLAVVVPSPEAGMTLPASADRKGKVLGFNAGTGDPELVTLPAAVRAVTVPDPELGMLLPNAATRASKMLGFDSAGAPLAIAASAAMMFPARADAIAATIPAPVLVVYVAGYTVPGKGGGFYKKVTGQPAHAARFQTTADAAAANSVWWELYETEVNPYQVGAVGDGVTDDTTAMQNWAVAAGAIGAEGLVTKGVFLVPSGTVTLANNTIYRGVGETAIVRTNTVRTVPLFLAQNRTGTHVRDIRFEYTAAQTTFTDQCLAVAFFGCTRSSAFGNVVWGAFYMGIEDRTGNANEIVGNRLYGVVNRPISVKAFEADNGGSPAVNYNAKVLFNHISGISVASGAVINSPGGLNDRTWTAGQVMTNYGININDYNGPGKTNQVVEYLAAHNSIVSSKEQGIESGGRCYGTISNNAIAGVVNGYGVLVEVANSDSENDVSVLGNRIKQCQKGIYFSNDTVSSSDDLDYWIVQGNEVTSCTLTGIDVVDARYGILNGNKVRGCGGTGFNVQGNTRTVVAIIFSSNLAIGNGFGVVFNSSTDRCAFANNISYQNSGGNWSASGTNAALDGASITA